MVDIYSDWAGPCTAMSGALKKIKLEVGDDTLVYAMAKSDTIPQLSMFRGHCKPTYLFIASGITTLLSSHMTTDVTVTR